MHPGIRCGRCLLKDLYFAIEILSPGIVDRGRDVYGKTYALYHGIIVLNTVFSSCIFVPELSFH